MNGIECECVVGRCSSQQHGGQLAAAATMRAEQPLLAAYMRWLCGTCGRVTDSTGRTALHLAASCGHGAVVRWLVRRALAGIDVRDIESGYTALHRSVFYGQIHVAADLIKMGANITLRDHDGLTAIDHAMKDRPPIVEFNAHNPCEVYVWGTNNNYSLGTGNEQSRSQPELLDAFRKQGISIKQVAMHKFHSIFVSHDGRVFSCGHGQGGRLGLNSEVATLTPREVCLQNSGHHSPDGPAVSCAMACVGRDHTLLLMGNGTVWSCGLNSYHQLGHSPPPASLLLPRQLTPQSVHAAGESVLGICASRFHTVIWGQRAVLTCGLNAGQLGHSKGPNSTIVLPRQVAALSHKSGQVLQVSASDGATVVAVERTKVAGRGTTVPDADVYLLHKFECQKIATRLVGVVQLAVVGGHLDTTMLKRDQQDNAESREEEQLLRVLILDNRGELLLWQNGATPQLTRCRFSLGRPLVLTGVAAQTRGQMLLITQDGEAFQGEVKVQRPGAKLTTVQLKRVPHIHRAVAATSDPKGRNFAIMQAHPLACLLEVPQMERSNVKQHLNSLLQEASEDDCIHDIVFQVGTARFPAHRYIVASRSEFLAKRILEHSGRCHIPQIELNDTRADVFRQVLQFIYTNDCSLLQTGECPIKMMSQDDNVVEEEHPVDKIFGLKDPNSLCAFEVYSNRSHQKGNNSKKKALTNTTSNPVRLVQETAKRFGLTVLSSELEKIRYEDGHIMMKQGCRLSHLGAPLMKREDFQNLYDVRICSEDGQELRAHKCVLIARSDYFRSMLSGRWLEMTGSNDCVMKLPLPYAVLEILLDFMYTDTAPTVLMSKDLEFLSTILVAADQLLVVRLKEAAEVAMASSLTLRNVGEVLQLSGSYNARQLKRSCFQYISLNLPAVLEARILESVSRLLLEDLTKYYHEFIPAMGRRIVTPYSNAPSHELLKVINDTYPISPWDEDDTNCDGEDLAFLKKGIKTAKKKVRSRKISMGEGGSNRAVSCRTSNESVGSGNSGGDEMPEDHQEVDMNELTKRHGNNQSEDDITLSLSYLMLSKSPDTYAPQTPPKAESPWVKIRHSYDKQQRIVQARLKAVSAAKEMPVHPTPDSFTKLVPVSRQEQRSLVDVSAPISLVTMTTTDFPELQRSSPPNHHDHSKMPGSKYSETKKVTKLSQRQRKKLAADQQIASPEISVQSEPAWRNFPRSDPSTNGNLSFSDIMKQEMQQMKAPPVQKQHQQNTSMGPGCNNPWVRGTESPQQDSESRCVVNFIDIVAEEKKQRDNWSRMRAKPLQLTQLEDKAIEDLLVFYNAAGATEEHITVKRVITGTVAPPTWITSHH